jgi:hypothetical protein
VWAILGLAITHIEAGDRDGAREVLSTAHQGLTEVIASCEPDTIRMMPIVEAYESSHEVDRQEFPAAELGSFADPGCCDCGEPDCIHDAFMKLPH